MNFSFDFNKIIKNKSFSLKSDKIYAISGKTGCGKSTFANLLLKIYEFEGEILLNGENINFIQIEQLRNQITVCSQFDQVIGGTLEDNIRYGLKKDDRL